MEKSWGSLSRIEPNTAPIRPTLDHSHAPIRKREVAFRADRQRDILSAPGQIERHPSGVDRRADPIVLIEHEASASCGWAREYPQGSRRLIVQSGEILACVGH